MKMILTHPDNKRFIERLQMSSWIDGGLAWAEVRFDAALPRFGPCKKIELPDGRIIEREKFSWRCGPVTYGLEDLVWLMWSGVVKEQFEPVFYVMEKPLSFVMDFMKIGAMKPSRNMLLSSCW